jgi:lipopolysaccharide export system permease protein
MGAAIAAVFGLRMGGFALSFMTLKSPIAPLLQYLLLFGAIGVSLQVILAGTVLEPPAALMEAINRSNARLLRLLRRPAAA